MTDETVGEARFLAVNNRGGVAFDDSDDRHRALWWRNREGAQEFVDSRTKRGQNGWYVGELLPEPEDQ